MKEYDNKGNINYEGEYINGKRHGKGIEYYDEKIIFEGEYLYEKEMEKEKNMIMIMAY